MSTDKTLADVQSGGRVRLGDQAHVKISDDLLSRMAYAIPGAVETPDKAKVVAARVVEIYLSSCQPSEAVDLRQFRDLIGFAALAAINLPETDPRRDFIRQANEFAKLIDSQVSGNG